VVAGAEVAVYEGAVYEDAVYQGADRICAGEVASRALAAGAS
jgi:hypothetical protein